MNSIKNSERLTGKDQQMLCWNQITIWASDTNPEKESTYHWRSKVWVLTFDSNPVPDVVGQTAFHNLCTGTVFRRYGFVHALLKPEKQRNIYQWKIGLQKMVWVKFKESRF